LELRDKDEDWRRCLSSTGRDWDESIHIFQQWHIASRIFDSSAKKYHVYQRFWPVAKNIICIRSWYRSQSYQTFFIYFQFFAVELECFLHIAEKSLIIKRCSLTAKMETIYVNEENQSQFRHYWMSSFFVKKLLCAGVNFINNFFERFCTNVFVQVFSTYVLDW
jgi:hypothetical protein